MPRVFATFKSWVYVAFKGEIVAGYRNVELRGFAVLRLHVVVNGGYMDSICVDGNKEHKLFV
jgi:hypothetical protein